MPAPLSDHGPIMALQMYALTNCTATAIDKIKELYKAKQASKQVKRRFIQRISL